jgi:peroxiredoxin
LDAEVIGVSADRLEENARFAAEHGIDFALVSDTGKSIGKSCGWGRVTCLIDKKGVIRYVQKAFPKNIDFLDKLKTLQ